MLQKTVTLICCMSVLIGFSAPAVLADDSDGRPGFFKRHKKLKKILLLGGVGAATGGVGAMVLGRGVASGAATGAGTKIGIHAAKEKFKDHKERRH